MKSAIFPGSFDPFTIGHADIVKRGLQLFDHLVIAIGINEGKKPFQSVEQRLEAIRTLYANEPRVEVATYTGLTVDFAHQLGINTILRGVRSIKDFEYERDIADINNRISDCNNRISDCNNRINDCNNSINDCNGIETVLLFSKPEFAAISSSVVRELSHFGKDVTDFLP